MKRADYRITLKVMRAQRKRLIAALQWTNYQLGLYASPGDAATHELIALNDALIYSANSALNLEKRLVHQKAFDPFCNLLEKQFRE